MTTLFPLKERSLNRGCPEHKAAGLGCAADYRANYVELYSPVDGTIFLFQEAKGGNWIRVTDAEGRHWEMAHLSERLVKTGDRVRVGQLIGVTGNTGSLTTGPHLHLQVIKNGKRIDPVPLLINVPLPMSDVSYNKMIIRNQETGAFALVVRGKKYQFGNPTLDTSGLITFLQVNDNKVGKIENVQNSVFDSIPNSDGLKF